MNLFLRTWSPFWILWKDKSKFSLFHFRIVGLGLLVRSMASSMDSLNNKIIFTISHSSWVPAENWVLCCFLAFKPVYTKAFRNVDYKFKIGAIRILLSEKTFAWHWESVVDFMENIDERQQCLRSQLWFNQNIRSSIQKVPMTASSRGT